MHMRSKRGKKGALLIIQGNPFIYLKEEESGKLCSYLILLGEAEAVVGLKSLYVVSQVNDRNWWVFPHSWRKEQREKEWEMASNLPRNKRSDRKVSEAAGGTMRWLWQWGECKIFNNAWGDRKTGWWHFGDVVMPNVGDRSGTGTEMHMSGVGKHASWRKREADISPASGRGGGGDAAGTHKPLQIRHTVTPYHEKGRNWLVTSQNSFLWNPFSYNRLSFGPAWSAWAGLISNNPPAAL